MKVNIRTMLMVGLLLLLAAVTNQVFARSSRAPFERSGEGPGFRHRGPLSAPWPGCRRFRPRDLVGYRALRRFGRIVRAGPSGGGPPSPQGWRPGAVAPSVRKGSFACRCRGQREGSGYGSSPGAPAFVFGYHYSLAAPEGKDPWIAFFVIRITNFSTLQLKAGARFAGEAPPGCGRRTTQRRSDRSADICTILACRKRGSRPKDPICS